MTRWYRAYAGTVKDDKLAEVSVIAGCSRSVAIATWHAILESAAETADHGRFETTARRIAAALCEPSAAIEAVFDAMIEIGMIDGNGIPAWRRRQFESDSSTERSRKHRATQRNVDATLQQQDATPPDTEAETDRDKPLPETNSSTPNVRSIGKPMRPERDDWQEKFWKAYPSRGDASNPKAPALEKFARAVKGGADPAAIVAAAERYAEIERKAGRAGTDKVAQAMTWLNQRRWQDYAQRVEAATPSESQIFVVKDTPAWEAWQKVTPDPLKPIQAKAGYGRYFPSQWPPDARDAA